MVIGCFVGFDCGVCWFVCWLFVDWRWWIVVWGLGCLLHCWLWVGGIWGGWVGCLLVVVELVIAFVDGCMGGCLLL